MIDAKKVRKIAEEAREDDPRRELSPREIALRRFGLFREQGRELVRGAANISTPGDFIKEWIRDEVAG